MAKRAPTISLLALPGWAPEGDWPHATACGPRFSTGSPGSFLSVEANPGRLNTSMDSPHAQRRQPSCLYNWRYLRRLPPKETLRHPRVVGAISASASLLLSSVANEVVPAAETVLPEAPLRCGGCGWAAGECAWTGRCLWRVGASNTYCAYELSCAYIICFAHIITHISCFAHTLCKFGTLGCVLGT